MALKMNASSSGAGNNYRISRKSGGHGVLYPVTRSTALEDIKSIEWVNIVVDDMQWGQYSTVQYCILLGTHRKPLHSLIWLRLICTINKDETFFLSGIALSGAVSTV